MSLHSTVKNGHLKIFTYLNPFKLILNYCSFDLLLLVLSKLNYHHRGQLQGTGSQDSGSPSRDFWGDGLCDETGTKNNAPKQTSYAHHLVSITKNF